MSTFSPVASSVVVSVGVQCHVGLERTENQDRVTRAATPYGDLFVVADGVGGYRGGAEAAQATVDGFITYLVAHPGLPLPEVLQQAVSVVNADLQQRSAVNQQLHGMGSTVVLCIIHGDNLTYAHVGDSRAYLLRDQQLQQLTRDHSLMERMVSQGILTPEQASDHPDASVLTRALGQGADASLDIAGLLLRPGDALLLCSDGLWAYARHEEMETIANSTQLSPSAIAEALLNLALKGGGGDNISIQFLRFEATKPVAVVDPPRTTRKKTFAVAGLVSLLAVVAAGLFLWIHGHRLPVTQPSVSVAHTAATPGGNPADKTRNGTAVTPKGSKPRVVIIDAGKDKGLSWTRNLARANYLSVSQASPNPQCHALQQTKDVVFYLKDKVDYAKEVASALSIATTVEKTRQDLNKCGAGVEIIAMPAARHSPQDQSRKSEPTVIQNPGQAADELRKRLPPLPGQP